MELITHIVECLIAALVFFILWLFVRDSYRDRFAQKTSYHGYSSASFGFPVLAGSASANQPILSPEHKMARKIFEAANEESALYTDLKRIARHGSNAEVIDQVKQLNELADLNPKMVLNAIGEEGLAIIRSCKQ
jgi:hypothetical protein